VQFDTAVENRCCRALALGFASSCSCARFQATGPLIMLHCFSALISHAGRALRW
jgi:hypothetical protein